jgi:hypothetical protein
MNLSEFATISGRAAALAPRRGTRDSFTVYSRQSQDSDGIVSVKTATTIFFELLSLFPSSRFSIGLAQRLLSICLLVTKPLLNQPGQKTASGRHCKSSLLDSIAGE